MIACSYCLHLAHLLQFMDVQMQCGTCYCGLFAIAFTTAIVLGAHPEQLIFDQQH